MTQTENTTDRTPGLKRYYQRHKHRPVTFYNPYSQALFSETSGLTELGKDATLEQVLAACDTRVLYLLPGAGRSEVLCYPGVQEWLQVPGIQVKKFFMKTRSGTVLYQGKQIDVRAIATWFSMDTGPHLKNAVLGYRALQTVLDRTFQPNTEDHFSVELLATASQTGNDLLMRSLPYHKVYMPLPDIEAAFLRENFTQGRKELFFHGKAVLPDLHNYDGRWMYAACVRHVPVGEMIHDRLSEVAMTAPSKTGTRGYIPGFYQVEVTVPPDWNHIGILPCQSEGTDETGDQKFTYPNVPGTRFLSYCGSPELSLALKYQWSVTVMERLLWPDTYNEPEPLKLWSERLINVRQEIALTYDEPLRSYLQDAARKMLLGSVGFFNYRQRRTEGYRILEDVPDDYEAIEPVDDTDLYWYTQSEELSPYVQKLLHPEWSHFVWSTARRKVTEAALQVPYEHLLAIRTDGIWATCPVSYADNGKPGKFREKPLVQGSGLAWPLNEGQIRKVMNIAKGKIERED